MNVNLLKQYRYAAWHAGRILFGLWLVLLSYDCLSATITSKVAGGSWATPGTWVGDAVPLATDDVVIAGPVIVTANATCAGIVINGATLTLNTARVLTVNGPWLNNGVFDPVGTATVSFGAGSAVINEGTGTANFLNITIASGANLTINTNVTVSGSFIYATPAASTNSRVTVTGTNSLTVTGAFTISRPGTNGFACTLDIGAGILTVDGLFTMQASTSSRNDSLKISTGTVHLNNGFTHGTTGCIIAFSDSGTINVSGAVSNGPPALIEGTGTVNFLGGDKGVWAETFYNLGISAGDTTFLRGTTVVRNALTVGPGSVLDLNSRTITLSGTDNVFVNNGEVLAGTSTVTFSNTAAQNVPAMTYNNLTFTGVGPKTIIGPVLTIAGNWANSSPTIMTDVVSATITGNLSGSSSGNTFSLGSAAITLSGNWTNTITIIPGESLVHLNHPDAVQTIRGNFHNLRLSGTGKKTTTSTLTVSGVLTVDEFSTLNIDNDVLSFTGGGTPFVVDGTFEKATGSVTFSGATEQNIPGLEYNGLTFSGGGQKTVATGDTVIVNGTWGLGSSVVVMEGTASAVVTGSTSGASNITMEEGTLLIGLNFVVTTFNPGEGKVHYNGSAAAQTIKTITYYNLEFSGTSQKNISSGTTFVNNVLTINPGTVVSLGSSRTLTLSGGGTPFINNGTTLQGTSTVNYTSDQVTTIAPASYYNLNAAGGDRILASEDTIHVFNTFTPGAGTYTVAGSTMNFNNTGNQAIPAFNYHNLDLRGGGNRTLPANLTVGIAGNFNQGDAIHTVTNSTVHFNGSGLQTIPAFNYHNLDGTGGDRILAPAGTIGIAGLFTPGAGVYQVADNIVNFNGTSNQTIPAFTFNQVILSGSGQKIIDTEVTTVQIEIETGPTLNLNSTAGGILNVTN